MRRRAVHAFYADFDATVETIETKDFNANAVEIERLLDHVAELLRSEKAARVPDPAALLIGLADAIQKTQTK